MRILKISSKNFKEVIKKVIKSIKNGKVIICPTDTVYGLLCDAKNERAVKKLLKIKKRQKVKPIPIFVKDLKVAKEFAKINKTQEKFLKKFWPGKVTIVLKRLQPTLHPSAKAGPYILPEILFGNKRTIGLRIPNCRLINILLEKLNFPLTGTSANISGRPPSTKIREILNQFENQKNQPDLVLDVGDLKPSLPSTVIDLTKKFPKILREGAEKIKVKKLTELENL